MQVILNADDFGRSTGINAAVVLAHRQGVLTSTSLMVNEDAAQEAVALARQFPSLAVGLHVVVIAGRSALPHRDIPHLVDGNGNFPVAPLPYGLRLFSGVCRKELAIEMEAQFERFAATGLPLSHADSHTHFHVHPVVFDLLATLAERYGARGLRVPRDELGLALRYDRHRSEIKILWAIVFGLLNRRGMSRLKNCHLAVADRVYGLMETGEMTEPYVVSVLRGLKVSSAELYFHPSTEAQVEKLGPNPGDLATLLSPAVRQVIEERGLQPTTYLALRKA